jgi:hypothetical protein
MEMIAPTAELEQRQGNLGDGLADLATWTDSSYVEDYLERNGEF